MFKVVLLMVLCSEIAANDCKVIPTPQVLFDDYSSCIVYGYDYSHTLMASFDPEWTNSYKAYTKFSCESKQIVQNYSNLSARPKKGTNKQKV